jgi:hypothetical protein
MQTALDIRGLRCLASLGTKIEDAEFSRLGKWLAFTATPRELHVLADVIEGDLFGSRIDARRANIAQSWFAAVYRNKKEPTLAQVKEHFLGYFNQQMLPGDHSIRKTLKLIGLPLAKGKVGRPKK